jgi:hypothetical protein
MVRREFEVCLLAPGTPAGWSESLSLLKHESARKATKRQYPQSFPLRNGGSGNMGEVVIDFFLPYSRGLRDLPGGPRLFYQQGSDLLANSLGIAFFLFLGHRGMLDEKRGCLPKRGVHG